MNYLTTENARTILGCMLFCKKVIHELGYFKTPDGWPMSEEEIEEAIKKTTFESKGVNLDESKNKN